MWCAPTISLCLAILIELWGCFGKKRNVRFWPKSTQIFGGHPPTWHEGPGAPTVSFWRKDWISQGHQRGSGVAKRDRPRTVEMEIWAKLQCDMFVVVVGIRFKGRPVLGECLPCALFFYDLSEISPQVHHYPMKRCDGECDDGCVVEPPRPWLRSTSWSKSNFRREINRGNWWGWWSTLKTGDTKGDGVHGVSMIEDPHTTFIMLQLHRPIVQKDKHLRKYH